MKKLVFISTLITLSLFVKAQSIGIKKILDGAFIKDDQVINLYVKQFKEVNYVVSEDLKIIDLSDTVSKYRINIYKSYNEQKKSILSKKSKEALVIFIALINVSESKLSFEIQLTKIDRDKLKKEVLVYGKLSTSTVNLKYNKDSKNWNVFTD
ncbi:MAG TPA: hypothetical protein VNY73_05445 [Bacteroidia bacterium]|jgi:hypothetical protein|nr:hypothetical protein [Bacteroidia bacterium]